MSNDTMSSLIQKQKHFYKSGITRPLAYRLEQLKKLRDALTANEKRIIEA
ncbi:hypothetical protein CM49_02859 [Paenibacillus sp. P1XP2]|nr:hypothetical protein CM49_02859 [Paenibacillus sp. P1XP2]